METNQHGVDRVIAVRQVVFFQQVEGECVNRDFTISSAYLMHEEIVRERERIAEKEKRGLEESKTGSEGQNWKRRDGGEILTCEERPLVGSCEGQTVLSSGASLEGIGMSSKDEVRGGKLSKKNESRCTSTVR